MHSQQALAAKEIKSILKKAFPAIKFSVKSEGYAGGDSVRVSYENGVPTEEVDKLIAHYQYGHFDGMIDLYEYSNSRDDIPQTKYLFVNRDVSQDNKQIVIEEIKKDYGLDDWNDQIAMDTFNSWADQVVWRHLKDRSFA